LNIADDPSEVIIASAEPKPDFEQEGRAASSPLAATTLKSVRA
jgi:hypothetical protein